jgi:hypothetical protein
LSNGVFQSCTYLKKKKKCENLKLLKDEIELKALFLNAGMVLS